MSLTVINKKSDIVEYDENKYFFRIADILLENNEKIKYLNYLKLLDKISFKIQDFYLETISRVYTECHNEGMLISTIDNDLLDTIQNLNKTIIHNLMNFQCENYESDRYNTNIEKEFIKVYRIINNYDFNYYLVKAFDEWTSIQDLVDTYRTINIKYFNEEDEDDLNPFSKLLSFFDSKPKNTKQLTGNYQVKYIEDSSSYPEEIGTIQKVKKKNKKSKNKDKSNTVKNTVIGIGIGIVATAWYASKS